MPEESLTHQERLARIKRQADFPFTILVINRINRKLVGPVARLGVNPNTVTWLSSLPLVGWVGAFRWSSCTSSLDLTKIEQLIARTPLALG